MRQHLHVLCCQIFTVFIRKQWIGANPCSRLIHKWVESMFIYMYLQRSKYVIVLVREKIFVHAHILVHLNVHIRRKINEFSAHFIVKRSTDIHICTYILVCIYHSPSTTLSVSNLHAQQQAEKNNTKYVFIRSNVSHKMTYISICTHINTYVCVSVCMCVCVFTYLYIFRFAHKHNEMQKKSYKIK